MCAVVGLGTIGDSRAVDTLIATLRSGELFILKDTVFALGYIGDPRAIEPLIETLKISHLTTHSCDVLVSFGEAAVQPLIEAFQSTYLDEYARSDVVRALAKIGDPRAIEPLQEALERELSKEAEKTPAKTVGTTSEGGETGKLEEKYQGNRRARRAPRHGFLNLYILCESLISLKY